MLHPATVQELTDMGFSVVWGYFNDVVLAKDDIHVYILNGKAEVYRVEPKQKPDGTWNIKECLSHNATIDRIKLLV